MVLQEIFAEGIGQRPTVGDETWTPVKGITLNYSGGHMKYVELVFDDVVVVSTAHADKETLQDQFMIDVRMWMHSIPKGFSEVLKFDDFMNDVASKYKDDKHDSVDEDGEFYYEYNAQLNLHEVAFCDKKGHVQHSEFFEVARYKMRHRFLAHLGYYKNHDVVEDEYDDGDLSGMGVK